MKIIVTGDLVVNTCYDCSNIDPELVKLFKQSDLNIVNLEAPITSSNSEILKTGPNLKSEEKSTKDVLKILDVSVVTLANNHVLDFDEKGVEDTITFCEAIGVKTVGAGMNLKEAANTLIIETTAGKIALVNFAENEWTSATEGAAGSNPMDVIDNANQIMAAKEAADFVFVIVHGGHEYYNLPSPRMQKQYRFYAEQGADIVIGHHTHCINGSEIHKGVPIYYSLGNFLFTNHSSHEDWYTGLVLEIDIKEGKLVTALHPVKQEKKNFSLNLLQNEKKQEVLNRVLAYDEIIGDSSKLQQKWSSFVVSMDNEYLNLWSPLSYISNRYVSGLFRRLNLKGLNKKGLALMLNLMRCEAHADVSKEVIKRYLLK